MKLVIILIAISMSSMAAQMTSRGSIEKVMAPSLYSVHSELNAIASADLEKKLELFDSQEIKRIKEGFEKSLDAPTIADARFDLSVHFGKNQIAYGRRYFAMAQAQNPVFPQLKLTQFNDHKFSYAHERQWERFSLISSASWIIRKGEVDTKMLNDFIEDDLEFDPEAGTPYQFLSLDAKGRYDLEKDSFLSFALENINLGESLVNEKYFEIGAHKKLSSTIIQSEVALKTTSLEDWKLGLDTKVYFLRVNLETNSYEDFNQELAIEAFNLKLAYFNKFQRSPLFPQDSSKIVGATLSFTYL